MTQEFRELTTTVGDFAAGRATKYEATVELEQFIEAADIFRPLDLPGQLDNVANRWAARALLAVIKLDVAPRDIASLADELTAELIRTAYTKPERSAK